MDIAGNSVKAKVKVTNIDKEVPKITVKYSTTEITNKPVEVTITANEKIQEVEGWNLSDDNKVLTKTYSINENEKLTIYDMAGNTTQTQININNIDNANPEIEISYNTTKITNKDIEVRISANEKIQKVEGWTLSEDEKVLTKTYKENGEEEVKILDIAGNSIKTEVKVSNIDKEAPKTTVKYSTTDATNKPVEVTITSNEKIQEVEGWNLSDDNKELTKTYTTNENEKLTIYDMAGNKKSIEIAVNNIKDKEETPTKLPNTGWKTIKLIGILNLGAMAIIFYKKSKRIYYKN